MRGFGCACPCVIPARIAAVVTARGKRISSLDLGRTELGRNFQKGCAAGEWPCEARDGPRGSEARRGRSRVRRGKRAGEEERADSGAGCSARATRARAWERRLTHGPCWQAGERAAARAGQAAAWAVREWSAGRWLPGLVAVKRRWPGAGPSAVGGTDLCGLGQRRWWAGVERGKQRTGLGPGRGLGWWASGMGFGLDLVCLFYSISFFFSISKTNYHTIR